MPRHALQQSDLCSLHLPPSWHRRQGFPPPLEVNCHRRVCKCCVVQIMPTRHRVSLTHRGIDDRIGKKISMSDQQPAQRMPRARSHKRLASCLWHNELEILERTLSPVSSSTGSEQGERMGAAGLSLARECRNVLAWIGDQFQQCMPVCLFVSGCFGMYMPAWSSCPPTLMRTAARRHAPRGDGTWRRQ